MEQRERRTDPGPDRGDGGPVEPGGDLERLRRSAEDMLAAGDEAIVNSLRYAIVNAASPALVRSDVSVNGFIDDDDVALYSGVPLNGGSLAPVEWPDPGF